MPTRCLPRASFPTAPILAAIFLGGCLLATFLAAGQAPSGDRFDTQVRADMFAGLAGDPAALSRAMKLCEETLAKEPGNAQALVWYGSGSIIQGREAVRTGDYSSGLPLLDRGLHEMDDAVAKAPDQVGVLIPRGATLLEYSKHDPRPEISGPALQKGLADYEKVLTLQKSYWDSLPVHARGELLSGLAEGWLRAGDADKAHSYMNRIVSETPSSEYATRAQTFLSAATPPVHLDWHCIGCHAGGAQ